MDYLIDIISTVTCKKERKNTIVVTTFLNNLPYMYIILVQCYFSKQLWREEGEKKLHSTGTSDQIVYIYVLIILGFTPWATQNTRSATL